MNFVINFIFYYPVTVFLFFIAISLTFFSISL